MFCKLVLLYRGNVGAHFYSFVQELSQGRAYSTPSGVREAILVETYIRGGAHYLGRDGS